jgi:hypothetical protein
MLGSLLGKLYRRAVGRLLGLDALMEERLSGLIRRELDGSLRAFVQGEATRNLRPDIEQTAHFLASIRSADYFIEHMRMARNLLRREDLLRFAPTQCEIPGLVLKFGVFEGGSLRVVAEHTPHTVYDFDSFHGLPEDWTHAQKKGRFSLGGKPPQFTQKNIELVPGWFEDTLPAFLHEHEGSARFIHIDSDLYSSAVTILTHLRPRIVHGTVIQFDEYFNYPGWEKHEYKAFQEFIRDSGMTYQYVGFASTQQAVALKMT